jgi:hypothetical protein
MNRACFYDVGNRRFRSPRDTGSANPALLAVLRRLGAVVIRVPIAPEGIAEMVHLGWLDLRQCRQPAVLADVLIDLANAALDARLRPGR